MYEASQKHCVRDSVSMHCPDASNPQTQEVHVWFPVTGGRGRVVPADGCKVSFGEDGHTLELSVVTLAQLWIH